MTCTLGMRETLKTFSKFNTDLGLDFRNFQRYYELTDCQLLPAGAAKRPCLNFVRLFVGPKKTNLKIKFKKTLKNQ